MEAQKSRQETIDQLAHFIKQKTGEMSAIIREKMGEDSQEELASLLFQLIDRVASEDVLHVTSALVERFRPSEGSAHAGRRPFFSPEVVLVLGDVDEAKYYFRNGEMYQTHREQHHDASTPYVEVVSKDDIATLLTLRLTDEILGHLNLLLHFHTEPKAYVPKGYIMLKYFIPATDGTVGKWGFESITASSPEKAKKVMNSWNSFVWQRRLQRMEKIALYDNERGRWIPLQKNLVPNDPSAHALDVRTVGITETILELPGGQEVTQSA